MSLATLGAIAATGNDLPLPDTSSLSVGECLILAGGGGTTEAVVIRSIARGRNIGVTVNRGALGTLSLAHAAPTTVSTYDPLGGGGGSGVTPTLADVLAAGNTSPGDDIERIIGGETPYSGIALQTAASAGVGYGQTVGLTGGDGDAGKTGGNAYLQGGFGDGANSGPGGLTAHQGKADGAGGDLNLFSGDASTVDKAAGDVRITPGAGWGTGRNGLVILSLPTADPGVAGALYSDGAPSAGVPKAIKISGG